MRRGAAVLGLLALAACASHEPAERSPPVPTAAQAAPAGSPGFEMVAPTASVAPVDPQDMCSSAKLKYLIGRPKTDIPVPVNPSQRRVTCTSCPMTMDFSPMRLNILYDQTSGVIKEVKCG